MKECFIIGGGSSLKECIDKGLWDVIKGKDVWSINYAFMTMPFLPTREIWLDLFFFKNNINYIQKLYQQGVRCYTKQNNKYALIKEINTYEVTRDPAEVTKKMFSGRMGLSGFFALHLAVKENYEKIFIFGYDYGSVTNDKQTHYYQGKLDVLSTGMGKPELYTENNQVKKEVEDFKFFLTFPSKIYNVSPKSNIPYFQKLEYSEFLIKLNEVS